MEKTDLIFDVKVDLAESYLFGTAKGDYGSYAINIQGGKTSIVLPVELLGEEPNSRKQAILNISTDSGTVSMRSEIRTGRDMIEIYDDTLLERLARHEPRRIEFSIISNT